MIIYQVIIKIDPNKNNGKNNKGIPKNIIGIQKLDIEKKKIFTKTNLQKNTLINNARNNEIDYLNLRVNPIHNNTDQENF